MISSVDVCRWLNRINIGRTRGRTFSRGRSFNNGASGDVLTLTLNCDRS